MSSKAALDQIVGAVTGVLPHENVEYRQVLNSPAAGDRHVTPDGREWEAVRENVVEGKAKPSPFAIQWRGKSIVLPKTQFKLTTMFVEPRGLFLEANGGANPQFTLGGSAFMSPQANAAGTIWKAINVRDGFFQLTAIGPDEKGLVLEGNGGFDANNTLGGAAFMSPQKDASGTMWKIIAHEDGFFQLTTLFVKDKGLVLEGNGGFDASNTLGGAAFMSGQRDASGTLWKFVPVG